MKKDSLWSQYVDTLNEYNQTASYYGSESDETANVEFRLKSIKDKMKEVLETLPPINI